MTVEIRLDMKAFQKASEKMPEKLYPRMKQAFRVVGDNFLRTFIKPRLTGSPGVRMRAGTLARSFKKNVAGTNIKSLILMIFTDSKYARIHEKGGTIKPTKSKYLAIPLDAAKTGAGVSRYKSPRDVPGLKFGGYSKAGNPILRTVEGQPMYVLVQSVTIKPRLGMFKTWERDATKNVQVLNTAVGEVLKRF